MLKITNQDYLKEEQEIQNRLFNNIDDCKSTIMNSGAGSGKTYALIECLKYTLVKYGRVLEKNNQHIICITYTNVAAKEIAERLGNSKIVLVSTIHERLWDIIKSYKKELVVIHTTKITNEISKIEKDLTSDHKFSVYQCLSEQEKEDFSELVLKEEFKEEFYNAYNLKASDYKKTIKENFPELNPELYKNVGNFKTLLNKLYRLDRYNSCIQLCKEQPESCIVEYDARYNSDRLDRFKISHDTLLEYAKALIIRYETLQEILIDSYPYFFVDEYQDTNPMVIEILNTIDTKAKKIENGHTFFVGYFGDSVQNIYSDGVGSKIGELHTDCAVINKQFNRRSCNEVISVANRIRNDEIDQVSIFSDSSGGSVDFYYGASEQINGFIDNAKSELNDAPLHCFVLTNESVAFRMGFNSVYDAFKNARYYKSRFDQLSTELLSEDINKLGDIPLLLYRIIDFYMLIQNERTPVYNILSKADCSVINIEELQEILSVIKSIQASNMFDIISALCDIYNENLTHSNIYRRIIDEVFNLEIITVDGVKQFICEKLYPSSFTDEEKTASITAIEDLLSIDIEQFKTWYNYINRQYKNNDIVFHTYHGTKGLEFENVVIIMGNNFGRQKDFFNMFFTNYNREELLSEEQLKIYNQAKNLLYVSVTRAIKDLKILYTDPVTDFCENIVKIFENARQL